MAIRNPYSGTVKTVPYDETMLTSYVIPTERSEWSVSQFGTKEDAVPYKWRGRFRFPI